MAIKHSKICSKCKSDKPSDEFYKHIRSHDGLSQLCKICHCIESKRRHAEAMADPVRHAKVQETWNKNNRKRKEYFVDWGKKNRVRKSALALAWQNANPERVAESRRNHRTRIREAAAKGEQWGLQRKLKARMSDSIRGKLFNRGKQKHGRTSDFIPYSMDELRAHLESLFQPGMTWENYGSTWEIDHRVPDYEFEYSSMSDEGFQKSWALENLQPLWAWENARKWRKLPEQFVAMKALDDSVSA